jgi:hypothetical protein
MLTKREVIEKRKRNKILKSNNKKRYNKKKSTYIFKDVLCDIVLNCADIIEDYSCLGLSYNNFTNMWYTHNIYQFNKLILLYNSIDETKPFLILHKDPSQESYELLSSVCEGDKVVTYLQIPIKISNKSKIGKYGLRYDVNKNMWFTKDIENYLILKNINNIRTIELQKKRQLKLIKQKSLTI